MREETRTIIIEAPSGERFEAEIPGDMDVKRLAADFFESQGWPAEQDGVPRRAVVELVSPQNAAETKRLNGDARIGDVVAADGALLRISARISAEPVGPEPRPPDSTPPPDAAANAAAQLAAELAAQRAHFENRIQALEKRLDDTADSLAKLSRTLLQRPAQNDIQQSIDALNDAFAQLSRSLQSQTITFRSLPPTAVRQQLYQVLRAYFNRSELQELCYSLGIPYGDLPGATHQDKARELVEYARRYGRTTDLETAVLARRPHLNLETEA